MKQCAALRTTKRLTMEKTSTTPTTTTCAIYKEWIQNDNMRCTGYMCARHTSYSDKKHGKGRVKEKAKKTVKTTPLLFLIVEILIAS